MTQEDKNILLRDLSARLPHGIVVHYNGLARPLFSIEPTQHFQIILDNALDGEHNGLVYISLDVDGEKPKPYLRPMSSMTEEEKNELGKLLNYEFYVDDDCALCAEDDRHRITIELITIYIKYLIAHHFDYNGLIPMGLALEAPEDMYK